MFEAINMRSEHIDDDQSMDMQLWAEEVTQCLTLKEIAINHNLTEPQIRRAIQREDLRYNLATLRGDTVLWQIVTETVAMDNNNNETLEESTF